MNKYQQEFIGKKLRITESANETLRGVEGRIIDETKNTFTIETKGKTKKIMKQGNEFRIDNETIEGDKITKRPEDRIRIKER